MGKEMFFNGHEISKQEQIGVTQGEIEKAKKYEIKDSEFDKTKEQIDWDVIKNIFENIAQKSGINPKDFNFLGADKVLNCKLFEGGYSGGKEIIGRYSAIGNFLALNLDQIRQTAKEKGVDAKLMTLDTMLHEMCHAASHHTHTITRSFNNEFFSGKNEIEYTGAYRSSKDVDKIKMNQISESKRESSGDALDEAITEKLATDIFSEYAKRVNLTDKKSMDDYQEKFLGDENREYNRLVKFIEKLCELISKKTGVDQEIIWNGFIRGSFYKKTLSDPEIQQWFAQAFAPTFLTELGNAKKADDLFALIKKYDNDNV